MPQTCGKVHRSFTPSIASVEVRPRRDECAHRFAMFLSITTERSAMERVLPHVVDEVQLGAGAVQRVDRVGVPLRRSAVQRPIPSQRELRVDMRSRRDERVDHCGPITKRGAVERGVAKAVQRVDIRSAAHERRDRIQLAALRSAVQRRLPSPIVQLCVCISMEQTRDLSAVTSRRRGVQWSGPALVSLVDAICGGGGEKEDQLDGKVHHTAGRTTGAYLRSQSMGARGRSLFQ